MTAATEALPELRVVLDVDAHMRGIERGMAYKHACSVIDGQCLELPQLGLDHYHLGTIREGEEGDMLREAVGYLEWRGLLQRHEKNRDWIGILDECEASR